MLPLLVLVGGWLLLLVAGGVLLTAVPRDARARLLPAAPLLGAALLVVVLSGVTAVAPVDLGLLVVLAVLIGLGLVGRRRADRGLPVAPRRAAALLGVPVLAGLVPLLLALRPSLSNGGRLVLPTSNHDAYYYVGVTEWLQDHPGLRLPALGLAPSAAGAVPFEASALRHVTQHLRLGESLVQAALDVVLQVEAERSWYALTCLWLLLLAGAVVAMVLLVDLPLSAGGLGALAVTASPLVLRQVYNQNSASLLGLALAVLALTVVADALRESGSAPPWLASLLLGGWLGTYTEYAVVAVPALLVVVLLRPVRQLLPALRRAVVVGLLALALAPVVWLNAVRSLLFLAGLPETPWRSPFLDAPRGLVVARATGAITIGDTATGRLLPLLLVVGLVVGLLAALRAPLPQLWLGVPLAVAAALVLYSVVDPTPYVQQRVVDIGVPLVLAVAVVGWAALVARGGPTAVLGVLPLLLWAGAGLRTDVRAERSAQAQPRPVDASFAEAAGWVDELGGREGEDVSVVVGDFFAQLWIVEALRAEQLVAYPRLDPSYMVREQFWGGELDRYALVDAAAWVDAPAAAVVRSNARFRLLDLTAGPVSIATTVGFSAGRWHGSEPGPAAWMVDDGQLFVLRTPGVAAVDLALAGNPDLPSMALTVSGAQGAEPVGAAVPPGGASVRVALPGQAPAVLLQLDNVEPAAAAPSVGDARPLSVRLTGVRRA